MIEGFKHKKSPSDREFRYENRLPPIGGGKYEADTNQYVEDLKSGQNNILVAVRARPLNSKEYNISNYETIRVLDGRVVVLLDPQNQFDANDVFRSNRNKEQQYAFDFAFDQTVDTKSVFEKTTKFLIPGVLNGFNATVFAYGATGAGKTYTMLGGQNSPGIMYLTMMELFDQIQNNTQNKEYSVRVSYLEVYNETLRDLLSTGDQNLDLREDAAKGVVVSGVTEVEANTPGDVMDILTVGSRNRTMEATGANVVSSRSHAILQVAIEHRDRNQGISEEINHSKLSLIDLAGSERASNTNNTGQRLIEGANINRSLLALGNCITLLSEKHEKGLKNFHIPYRDSKLTRLLKDSLGGNCRTVMITNVSPAVTVFEDTYNTLKYANRAKNIKTSVQRNVLNVENHVEKYAQIINGLKQENDQLKKLLHNNQNKGLPDLGNSFEDMSSGSDQKQVLINDIKQHFDEEGQLKKRVFDAEIQGDEIEERIITLQNDMQGNEDKLQKARYDDLLGQKKRQSLKIEELKRDFNILSAKRNMLQARIQKEKSKDTMALLNSIFSQSKMHIENMDLQQKERRVNNQMRIKDKELKYLQNQLGMRDIRETKSLEVSNVQYLHTPSRANQNTIKFNEDTMDDSLSFLTELNEIDNNNRGLFTNAKNALYMPHVNPKVMYVSPSQASKRVLPPIKKLNIANYNDYGDPTAPGGLHSRQASQFYYKKHDFLVERTKPFEVNQSDRSNKKKKYVPFHTKMKNEVLTTGRRRDSFEKDSEGPKPKRDWQLSVPNAQAGAVKSLNDLSHISHSSAGPTSERVKNLRALSKGRVPNRYGNVVLRYGASPYVGGGSLQKSKRR